MSDESGRGIEGSEETAAYFVATRRVRRRTAMFLGVAAFFCVLALLIDEPWLWIGMAPLLVPMTNAMGHLLRPSSPPPTSQAEVLARWGDPSAELRAVEGSAAERLLEIQDDLDTLDSNSLVERHAGLVRIAGALGTVVWGGVAIWAVLAGQPATRVLSATGLTGIFGMGWWATSQYARQHDQALARLAEERRRLVGDGGVGAGRDAPSDQEDSPARAT